jgi:hypothetical protein
MIQKLLGRLSPLGAEEAEESFLEEQKILALELAEPVFRKEIRLEMEEDDELVNKIRVFDGFLKEELLEHRE